MSDKSTGFAIGCLSSVGILFLITAAFFGMMIHGCSKMICEAENVTKSGPIDEVPLMNEIWSAGSEDGLKVVRIPVNGLIMLSDEADDIFGLSEGSAAHALKSIKAATNDPSVQAILLELDTPGGGVTDSDIIYNALLNFKNSGVDRKVIVHMGDTCCSGGYYIAAAADRIIAHPTTTLGSIGVIINGLNLSGLAQKLGIEETSIASGKNKAFGGILGNMTEEQKTILKDIVASMHERFVNLVATGRNLPVSQVKDIADGRIFTAEQGIKLGLVDEVGYYDDVIESIKTLTDCDTLRAL